MATPKAFEIDPENLKKTIRDLQRQAAHKNIIIDPHGRERPRRELIHEEMPYNARGPLAQTVNHCQMNGGGMSTCYACHYSDDKSKIQCQRACGFFKKSSFTESCMWETFGEFCWSTKAQDDKKSKGF